MIGGVRIVTENPFVADIRSQADWLRRALEADLASPVARIQATRYDRIVMSGMGASLFALYPAWLACARAGLPAWWIETGELLHDARELITERTLLFLTSQSGTSAEIVALLDRVAEHRPACVLGVTNVPESPLGQGADVVVPILSGKEYSVSTRSYINTLAVTRLVADAIAGKAVDMGPFARAAEALDPYLGPEWEGHVEAIREALRHAGRVIIVGRGAALATAWQGALVIKEVAKAAVEGLSTAQFRHGPFELADTQTAVIMLEGDAHTAELDRRLAADLVALGARVLWIGANPPPAVRVLPAAKGVDVAREVVDVVPLEIAGVVLAEAGGFIPGEFRYRADIAKSL
jgi:glucosamine--fructose-6-phosphate aminotransferase (isomerizing)